MVNVRLLGEFALDIDGRHVPASAFPRRSAAALVKLLALAPSRRLHREQVMDALWPGLLPQDAANHLHKAAHYARRGTGVPGSVLLQNEIVALFPGAEVAVDAVEFEAAAAAAISADVHAADSALAAYPGGLLPEDPYESWAHSLVNASRCCTASCSAGRHGGRSWSRWSRQTSRPIWVWRSRCSPGATGPARSARSTRSNRSCGTSWGSA